MQSVLARRFLDLRNSRQDKPVFAIEHGFDDEELETLFHIVSLRLQRYGTERPFWRRNSLPLLVAASETGYRYRGTGTDFWPLFEDDLNVQLRLTDREELSSLFEDAHRRFGLKKPAETPWTKRYRHIAWPIANALAPVEIHRPLAQAVQAMAREGGWGGDSSKLLERLQYLASGMWSRRLSEWLEDGVFAMEVVNRLLWRQTSDGWLSTQVIERISADLASDRVAMEALSVARHRVVKKRAAGKVLPDRARLALIIREECPTQLVLVGPQMGRRADAVLSACAERSLLVRGSIGNITLEEFLHGGVAFLGYPADLPEDGFLVCGNAEDRQDNELLQALEPDCSRPLIFELEPDSGLALAINSDTLLDSARSYMVTEWFHRKEVSRKDARTAWTGLDYLLLDSRCDDDCALLESLGFRFGNELDVRILGGLPFEQMAGRMVLAPGMPLVIRSGRTGARIDLRRRETDNVSTVELGRDEQAVAELEPGEYVFELHQGRLQKTVEVLVREPEHPREAFLLEINPGVPFADDLLDGELAIVLKSVISLDGVDIVGALFASGKRIAEECLENMVLPARIGSDSPFLKKLCEALVDRPDIRTEYLKLVISVSGLAHHQWALPWRPKPYVFDGEHNLWFVEEVETGPVPSRLATLDKPLLQSVGDKEDVMSAGDLQLLVADAKGDDVLTCGICLGSDSVRPGEETHWTPARLLRERNSRGEAVGLLPVLEAFFAWSLASPSSLITDARRRRVACRLETVTVEQLCGVAWLKRESSLEYAHSSPLDLFLAIAGEQDFLEDERVEKELVKKGIDGRIQPELKKARREQFADLVSDMPLLRSQMNEEWAEKLDEAANGAYMVVRSGLLERGSVSFEEPDIGHPVEEWNEVLEKVMKYRDFPQLSPFILPRSRWDAICQADYCRSSEDDIVDILEGCHLDVKRGGGRWLGRRDFRLGLQIWLSPRLALETPEWRNCAGRLLSDRQTARAIRYAALRLRAARSTGGGS